MRQSHSCEVALLLWGSPIVVKHEAALLLWGSLIVVRQPHCRETASLWWGSITVLRQPYYCESSSKLWGNLIDVMYPHYCEVVSIFEALELMQSQGYWGWGWLTMLPALRLPNIAWNIEDTLFIGEILVTFSTSIPSSSTKNRFWTKNCFGSNKFLD